MNVKVDMGAGAYPDEGAMLQAERWAARLSSPDCTAEERQAFEGWRAANAAHAKAYASTGRLLRQVDALAGDPAIARALAEAKTPNKEAASGPRRLSRLWAPLPLAAGLAALSIAGAIVYRIVLQGSYSTDLGEQQAVVLEDGSKVMLDTATSLHVEVNDTQRVIELERGRAQFDVAPDPRRPFVVKAGGSTVTALGTVFDVRRDPTEVTVTLMDGKVEIAQQSSAAQFGAASREVLNPGERLVVSGAGRTHKQTSIDVDAAASWTRGDLVFKSTALAQVATEINRYAEYKIRVDPGAADIPISGVFHVGDTQALLIALEKSFPIKVIGAQNGEFRLVDDPGAKKIQ